MHVKIIASQRWDVFETQCSFKVAMYTLVCRWGKFMRTFSSASVVWVRIWTPTTVLGYWNEFVSMHGNTLSFIFHICSLFVVLLHTAGLLRADKYSKKLLAKLTQISVVFLVHAVVVFDACCESQHASKTTTACNLRCNVNWFNVQTSMNVRRWKIASVACVMDSALTWRDRTSAIARSDTGLLRTDARVKV